MATVAQPEPDSPDRVSEAEDRLAYLRRWLRVWIALLVVTTLTVVAFLVLIAATLTRVDVNAAVADRRVSAVRANVSILPGLLNTVNSHLAGIDRNLEPIPEQVRQVNDSLGAVNSSLAVTSRSLADTADTLNTTERSLASTDSLLGAASASLRDTEDILTKTESTLVSVRDLAGKINATLEDAEHTPRNLGTRDIYQRVAKANVPLGRVQQDTSDILNSLVRVNGHLNSICESTTLQALGVFPPC